VGKMAPFVATRYIAKEEDDYSHYMGGEASTTWYQPYATDMVGATPKDVVQEEMLAEGQQTFHRGGRVDATDGHVGLVGELVLDEDGRHMTHFVLQEGHAWGKKEVTLPMSAIDHVEDDTVYLKLDKKAIASLPAIPLKRAYAKGEKEIELIARVFDDAGKAQEALEYVQNLGRMQIIKVIDAAVMVKDEEGNVTTHDTKEITAKKGRLMGAITGGLIGLLAGPGGAVIGALAGLGAGGFAGKHIDEGFSDKFLAGLETHLQPGKAALIMLMEHQWVRKASEELADLGGIVVQHTITDALVQDLIKAQEAGE
jgi:uncharacterized membrane protein